MLVFIDDSGDPGFKLDRGSSEFFIISMVIFADELEAEKTATAIKELRGDLGFSENAEFRFFKTSRDIRLKFLNTINPFHFKVRCLVVQKSLIRSPELKNNKNSFYSYFIKETLKHNDGSIFNAKIRIDGSGDRVFRKNFISYLRKELNGKELQVMQDCRMVKSHSNVLIQMADMVAGSIHRSRHLLKKDHLEYRGIIKKHIEDEWSFR